MLTEHFEGKSKDSVEEFSEDDLYRLLGEKVSAMRRKCAMTGLKAWKEAVED